MDWWSPGGVAIVLAVPAAEAVIGDARRTHSPSGRDGMTAHVTLLAPLVDWRTIEASHLGAAAAVAAAFGRFPFRLERFGRFPSALYLAPDPPEPFVELARALRRVVPAEPPRGGKMIPHVTVASRVEEETTLNELEREIAAALPIEAVATQVDIYERGDDLALRVRASLALGS